MAEAMHPVDVVQQTMLKGKYEQAKKIAEEYLLEHSNDPAMRFNYAWHILNEGQLKYGNQELDIGRHIHAYGMAVPLLPGELIYNPQAHTLEGKVVLFVTEGGFGDEIIQVRFVQKLIEQGAGVIICAAEALHCLFWRIPNIMRVITPNQVTDVTKLIDYWIPAFSSPGLLDIEYETLPNKPYLTAHPQYVAAWKSVLNEESGNKLKVGLRWEGNPKFEHQQFRRFPIEQMLKLVKRHRKNVHFFSLQLDSYELTLPEGVADLQQLLVSWEDTAAVIENLDLVISSCTSVAHLSASLGKETWVLVPVLPYHVWLPMSYNNGRGTPWYETVRLFRQTKYDNWHAPFRLLHKEFDEWNDRKQKEMTHEQ